MQQSAAQPSPQLLFDTISAYQQSAVIKAAIELDLFTAIAGGSDTAAAIAKARAVSERGARSLCDYVVTLGFLTKESDRYSLTPDAAVFLDRRSPAYLGGILEFLLSPILTDAFKDVAAAVRKGGTAVLEGGTVAPEHPVWVNFARAMAPITVMPATFIADVTRVAEAGKIKVLDIAAGHGMYGITIATKNPLAEVTGLDWPQVMEVAKENARAAGVIDRYRTIEGSAFDADFGSGYDLVLLTNFLHHFDAETCERVLRKVGGALAEGGQVATLEFVPNEDRTSPTAAARFSMMMLVSTPSGDAYTFRQLKRMFEDAGFSHNELHDLPGLFHRLIISRK